MGIVGMVGLVLRQFLRQKPFQPIQIQFHKLAKPLHPHRGGADGARVEFAPFHPPALFLHDQSGAGENAEMFGNRRQ